MLYTLFCRLGVVLALFMGGIVAQQAVAAAGVVLEPGVYVIQMSQSSLTVACSSDAVGSPLVLWPTRPTANWAFETTGNGYYAINSQESLLDGGSGKTGSPIIMQPYQKDWYTQMWKLVKVGIYYKFINMKTGQAMMLRSGRRTPGSTIENAPVSDSMDQLFCIQRIDNVGYCGEGDQRAPQKTPATPAPSRPRMMDEYED